MQLQRSEIVDYFHNNQNLKEAMNQLFDLAKDHKSWICPLCGNGANKGDGIHLYKDKPGYLKCFSGRCDFYGDIFDLIGEYYGLEDLSHQIEKVSELLYIDLVNDYTPVKKSARSEFKIKQGPIKELKKEPVEAKKEYVAYLEDTLNGSNQKFKKLIEVSHQRINEPRALEYIRNKRGLNQDTIEHFNLGYATELEVGNKIFKECILFPTSNGSYCVRDMDPNVRPENKTRKPKGSKDIPLGFIDLLEEKDKKMPGYNFLEPIFLVEGLIDAPSIYQAGGDAIALNGTNVNNFIELYNHYGIKRPVILALDQDGAGLESQKRAYNKLKDAGISVYPIELIPDEIRLKNGLKDANDFLLYDQDLLKERVEALKNIPYNEFLHGFNKYQKKDYINRITSNREKIKTGFEVLDSENFLDGGLDEGLYFIGAISSLGKTTFTLQVADQIASAGHDVIFYSLEMAGHELRDKSISRYSAKDLIEAGEIENNTGYGKYNRLAKTQNEISHKVFNKEHRMDEQQHIHKAIDNYFKDTGEHLRIVEAIGEIDADDIRKLVEDHIAFTGNKPVVFIDYIQLLKAPKDSNGKRPNMTDKQVTDANVLKLKQLARDFHVPIWGISSFNRESYNQKVSMKSFKESGAIEYSSDVLLALQRKGQGSWDGKSKEVQKNLIQAYQKRLEREEKTSIKELELKILKNRNGKADKSIDLEFYALFNYYKETDLEQVNQTFNSLEKEKRERSSKNYIEV